MSKAAQPLFDAVKKPSAANVAPMADEFYRLGGAARSRGAGRQASWSCSRSPEQGQGVGPVELLPAQPHNDIGRGLTNLDYAYIAAELGKQPLSPGDAELLGPDTGNMEVLERVGTPEQKERWLKPLLNGEIRSAFAMTEPGVARPMPRTSRRAELVGNEWADQRREILHRAPATRAVRSWICMVRPAPRPRRSSSNRRSSVPKDTPGVHILGPMHVFGHDHAPRGHAHQVRQRAGASREHPAGRGPHFEIPDAARSGSYPSLHALDRPG